MAREFEISEIKRIVNLIQHVDCTNYALVADVAKEMAAKKTELMQFIEDNPKLFSVYRIDRQTKNVTKTLGLGIGKVYLTANENPDTEEWLDDRISEWDKKIHVSEMTYYGQHEYYYIPEDDPNSDSSTYAKQGKYRNTPEKIKALVDAGILKKVPVGIGSLGDYRECKVYLFNAEVRKALKEYGWTTDFNKL